MNLNELKTPKGATHKRKMVGRGYGSGHGKTSCRGMRGQRCRSGGGPRIGFEGGQMPLSRRIPKRGFKHTKFELGEKISIINLKTLIEKCAGVTEINPELLYTKGLAASNSKIKILGDGEIKTAIKVLVHSFSKSAKEKILAAGGAAEIIK